MKETENKPQPRKRRKWGSVIVRKDADGNPTSLQARYVNPLDPREEGRPELRPGIRGGGIQMAR